MNFSELIEMADKIVEKTGIYTSVMVEYDNHPNGFHDLEYRFYQPVNLVIFKTAHEIKYHMESILNPVEDEGIELEGKEAANV